MKRHIVLVGLPGSGKSVTGRVVAATLGCPCCDLDGRIAAREGMTIAEIFAARGEAAFRDLERAAMDEALREPPQVITPGGGWAAQPGNLERARPGALVVHLACAPDVAARRLKGTDERPLVAGNVLERLRHLSAVRQPFYERAEATVDAATHTVEQVARAVVVLARSQGGW